MYSDFIDSQSSERITTKNINMKIQDFLDKILESEESFICSQKLDANTLGEHRHNLAVAAAKRKGLVYATTDCNLILSEKGWRRLHNKAEKLAKKDFENFLNAKVERIMLQALTLKNFGLFTYDVDDLRDAVVEFVNKYYR